MKIVQGAGNGNAKLMIVGEAPGADEETQGEPFVGPVGRFTREMLEQAGMTWGETFRSNIERVRPPNNNLKLMQPLLGKKPFDDLPLLWEEIRVVKPNAILALGGHALEGLTGKHGITHYRGSILPSLNGFPKIIPSIHPSNLLQQRGEGAVKYNARYYVQLDFKRAVEQSQFKDFKLPMRRLEIIRTVSALQSFLDQYRHKKRASIDIEVCKAIPVCIGLAFNKYHAVSIPLLNVPGWRGEKLIDAEKAAIWKLLDQFLSDPSLQIIGQNFKFDHQKLLAPCNFGVLDCWFDTRAAMHCCFQEFPGSLEFMTSVLTEEPYYKSELKEFDPRYKNPNDLLYYNARDAAVTYEVFEKLYELLSELGLLEYFFTHKQPLHKLYMDIEGVGFAVDDVEQQVIITKYNGLITAAESRFQFITGINPYQNRGKKTISIFNSPKEIAKLFVAFGFPHRESYGEEVITALMANHAKRPEQIEVCQLTLDIRRYKKVISTYATADADYDGRMRTSINYCAAVTGRSGNGVLKPPVRPKQMGVGFSVLSKHGDIGPEVRGMLVADKGEVIINCDLSQAEPRIVSNLAEDWQTLSEFGVIDVHRKAAVICGLAKQMSDMVSKDDPRRFIGKTIRNAAAYDVQKHTAMVSINTDAKKLGIPLQISEAQAGVALKKFHQGYPSIKETFHKGIKSCLEKDRILINPFGRKRKFYGEWNHNLLKEAYSDIPQSTVIDQLRMAMLRVRQQIPGIRIVLEAHDAFAFFAPDNPAIYMEWCAIVKAEMERAIDFSQCSLPRPPLVIPAEFEIGINYKDLTGFKVVT